MDPSKTIYADGIQEISIYGGMVRLDLFNLDRGNTQDEQPQLVLSNRVVMPPDAFLRSFAQMENLVKQLIDAGVVKPREAGTEGNSEVSSGNGGTSEPPKSPNF